MVTTHRIARHPRRSSRNEELPQLDRRCSGRPQAAAGTRSTVTTVTPYAISNSTATRKITANQRFLAPPSSPGGRALQLSRFYANPLFSLLSFQQGRGACRCICHAKPSQLFRPGVASVTPKRCISPPKCRFRQLNQSLPDPSCSLPVFPVNILLQQSCTPDQESSSRTSNRSSETPPRGFQNEHAPPGHRRHYPCQGATTIEQRSGIPLLPDQTHSEAYVESGAHRISGEYPHPKQQKGRARQSRSGTPREGR